jgi:hypothetical protein
MGTMYFDLTGKIKAINHATGAWAEIEFSPKKRSTLSSIEGYGFDNDGNKLFEIKGSWLDKITLKNLRRCTTETIWDQPPPLENESQQFGFA